jgi:hypothetical protein
VAVLLLIVRVNSPAAFVIVPVVVPSTTTATPGKGNLSSSTTFPLIVVSCANRVFTHRKDTRNRIEFFIFRKFH